MPEKIYLTRRNLLTLLSKLDRKGKGEETACALVKRDSQHETYPQTMKAITVVAVEYGGNFTGRTLYLSRHLLTALLSDLDQKKTGKEVACIAVIKQVHVKKVPKVIEVLALENQEYYSGLRLPGEVHHADVPV